jgi:selenocysteine lyase/cysteine desulfurase
MYGVPLMAQTIDWGKLRGEFPAVGRFTYLDTATFGQLPRCGSEAVIRHLTQRDETASTKFLSWFDDMDLIRQSVARLVNAAAADIAFVQSASNGLSYFMQGLDWRAGDEVLTLAGEFPNQIYQSAAVRKFGVTHRAVAWADFYAAVSEKTRVVLLSTVNYATGFLAPMDEISRFLHERGVLLYVDGTQSVGALGFDVGKVRPAMLCVNAYKWMMSPNGAGFVYVDEELRRALTPTVVGWRSDAGWRKVASLNHGEPVFAEAAEKFEGGMIPFPSLYAMGAVVDLLLETGMDVIEGRVLELAAKTRAMLSGLGAEVNGDASQIVTARLPGRDAAEVAAGLKAAGIFVSARHGRLRVSAHLYNNEDDIEILRAALSQ